MEEIQPVSRATTQLEIIYWHLNRLALFQIMNIFQQSVIVCQAWICYKIAKMRVRTCILLPLNGLKHVLYNS